MLRMFDSMAEVRQALDQQKREHDERDDYCRRINEHQRKTASGTRTHGDDLEFLFVNEAQRKRKYGQCTETRLGIEI